MSNILKCKGKFPGSHILEEQVKFYSVKAKNIYISFCGFTSYSWS